MTETPDNSVRPKQRKSKNPFPAIAKGILILSGPIDLLGVLWFLDVLTQHVAISGTTSGISSLLVAAIPRRMTTSTILKLLVTVLCLIGTLTTAFLIANNLLATESLELDVVSARTLQLAAFVVIGIDLWHVRT